jgi:hypothetical protein
MRAKERGEGIEDHGGIVEGVCKEAVGLGFGDEKGTEGIGTVDSWMGS